MLPVLSARGIMKGETANGSTYFRPNRNLTRQEFAVTMARLLNLDTSSTSGTRHDEDSAAVSIGRCLPRGYAAVSLNYTDASVIPSWATEQSRPAPQ